MTSGNQSLIKYYDKNHIRRVAYFGDGWFGPGISLMK
jgi:hypothetical protein